MNDDTSVRTEFRSRNRTIAKAVLEGESVASVAREWSLSKGRCHQLVHTVCRRLEPELYRSLLPPNGGGVRMEALREYVDAFNESMEEDGDLTAQSSIRRIRELPTMTMNALLHEGIRTVQDLMDCQPETLLRVPVIGREALRKIQHALHRTELA